MYALPEWGFVLKWCKERMLTRTLISVSGLSDEVIAQQEVLLLEGLGASIVVHLSNGQRLQLLMQEDDCAFCEGIDEGTVMQFADNYAITFRGVVPIIRTVKELRAQRPTAYHPLDPSLTLQKFQHRCYFKMGTLHETLTSELIVYGIDAYYADEIAFRAGIHLDHRMHDLHERWSRIYDAMREVMTEACASGGRLSGQYVAAVAERAKKPCPVCGQPVKTMIRHKQKHFYCGGCQT